MFDFMFYDPSIANDGVFSFTAKEGSYNTVVIWRKQVRSVINGVIGPLDTYQHEVASFTEEIWDESIEAYNTVTTKMLKVRKQENEGQYVEYKIYDMGAMTLIQRGGLTGCVSKGLTDENFTIPLSYNFVSNLTPMEQMIVMVKSLRLCIYSAQVTHLEYYETPAFFRVISIVVTVVAIVLTIIYLPAGVTFLEVVGTMLAAAAVMYGLKWLMEQTDNLWLKGLIIVAAVIVALIVGEGQYLTEIAFATADLMTTAVTQYTEYKYELLGEDRTKFDNMVEARLDDIEATTDKYAEYIPTEFMTYLARISEVKPFRESVDLNIYRAVQLNLDSITLAKEPYRNLYNYDQYYRLNVV
jgi:hypothetical protein